MEYDSSSKLYCFSLGQKLEMFQTAFQSLEVNCGRLNKGMKIVFWFDFWQIWVLIKMLHE